MYTAEESDRLLRIGELAVAHAAASRAYAAAQQDVINSKSGPGVIGAAQEELFKATIDLNAAIAAHQAAAESDVHTALSDAKDAAAAVGETEPAKLPEDSPL
jgi:hypothetical protein